MDTFTQLSLQHAVRHNAAARVETSPPSIREALDSVESTESTGLTSTFEDSTNTLPECIYGHHTILKGMRDDRK